MKTAREPAQGCCLTRRELLKASLTAGIGLAGLSMAGCSPAPAPGAATAAPAKTSQINIITGEEITTLDPNKTNATETVSVIWGITDRLARMKTGQYGELGPLLATSWETPDPTHWRFKLRQGVKFHNGAEFNAETAKWTLDHYAKNALNKIYLEPVDRIETPDRYTVDIVTKFPYGLLGLYMNACGSQLDPRWMTGPEYTPEKLIGTGPCRFVEWVKGQRVVLEAFQEYWGGRVNYDRVVIRAIAESSTRANAAAAGEADITRNILGQDIDRVNARQGVKVATVPSNRVVSIRIRDDLQPFDNKLVRQALNYAVNVPEIVKSVLKGFGTPVQGQIQGPGARHWQKDVQPYPYDPEKAKSLLAQAGFPKGFTTKLGTSRGRDAGDFEFVQALAGQLKQVGVEAEVVLHEAADYQAIFAGQKESEPLFYYSSGNIIPDAENAFRDLLSQRSYMVHSKELADIYARIQRTVDVKEREPIAREGILLIRDYCPVIFGYQMIQTYAVSDRISWTPRPDEWIMLDELKMK